MKRAAAFYQGLLNIELTKMESGPDLEMMGFPSVMNEWGSSGAIVKMKDLTPSGVSTIVYFRSEDCEIQEKKVVGLGGTIHKPKMSIGRYGFITLLRDTEGNVIGVHSMN